MAFQKSYGELHQVNGPSCMHLRSKGMYVTGKMAPERETDGMGDGYCWCNVTQKASGPDADSVDRQVCTIGRSCFQQLV
jgi:hypothetical protein